MRGGDCFSRLMVLIAAFNIEKVREGELNAYQQYCTNARTHVQMCTHIPHSTEPSSVICIPVHAHVHI